MKYAPLLILAFAGSIFSEESSIMAKAIQITSCKPLPNGMDDSAKPFGYELGTKIFYIVEGEGLIGILESNALKIEYIKDINGKDVSRKRNGKDDYELGSFPEASDDGKYLTFSLEVKSNQFGFTDSLNVKGSLVGYAANDKKEIEIELDMGSKEIQKAGLFSFVNADNVPMDSKSVLGSAYSSMKFGNKEGTNIAIQGPMKNLIDLQAFVGDKKIERNGNSMDSESRVYMFNKVTEAKVKIKFSYWEKIEPIKILIDGSLKN